MSRIEPTYNLQMITSHAEPGEEEALHLLIWLKTVAGNTSLTITLTEQEKTEMNNLVEKIFQRFRRDLKNAL